MKKRIILREAANKVLFFSGPGGEGVRALPLKKTFYEALKIPKICNAFSIRADIKSSILPDILGDRRIHYYYYKNKYKVVMLYLSILVLLHFSIYTYISNKYSQSIPIYNNKHFINVYWRQPGH